MTWYNFGTYNECIDEQGRVKSKAWNNQYYPGLNVKVLATSIYANDPTIEHSYSRLIKAQKKRVDLSGKFLQNVINSINDYNNEFNFDSLDIVTPIPSRKLDMPFRPTTYSLSTTLAQKIGLEFDTILERTEFRERTSHSFEARFNANTGTLRCRTNVRNKTILLLDDVKTSGITLLESKKVLKRAGANEIIGLCLGVHVKKELYDEIKQILGW